MAFAVIGLALGAAGTFKSYSANRKSAQQTEEIANYNYEADLFNAEASLIAAEAQAEYQKMLAEYEAEIAARLYELDAEEFKVQAKNYENAAITERNVVKENIRLSRQDFAEMQSSQRVAIAKSNVVETGTPLDVLAETAGEMEAAVQTQLWESEVKQRELFYNAALQYHAADKSLYMADTSRYMGRVQAAGFDMQSESAKIQFISDQRAAEISRLTGMNQAEQYRGQATASLLSGLSNASSQYYNYIK